MSLDTTPSAGDMISKPTESNLEEVQLEDIRGSVGDQEVQVLEDEGVNSALERRVLLKCDLMILPMLATIYFLAQLVSISLIHFPSVIQGQQD